jgi:hypothetical protein
MKQIMKKIKNAEMLSPIIRLLYSQFLFHKIIGLFNSNIYDSHYLDLEMRFENFRKVFNDDSIFQGKIVLELGPGNSLFNAFGFLHLGAKRVYLVDKFPRKSHDIYEKEEREFFIKTFNVSDSFFDNLKEKIIFLQGDIIDIQLQDPIDFIYSNSVFEHIKNTDEFMNAVTNCLNKQGYIWGYIDLRDHYNFDKPYLFLQYNDYLWEHFLTKEGISYTNRLRVDDWKALFHKNSLKLLYTEEIGKHSDVKELKIHKKFLSKNYWVREFSFFVQKDNKLDNDIN